MLEDKYIIKRIQQHLQHGINSEDGGEASDTRQAMFNAYMGAEYGNERDGYSKIVTREVFQAVEWLLPAVIRIFLGAQRVVEFKPRDANDADQARLETDAINHWFFDGNPEATGFVLLYNFVKDLLLNQNAYWYVRVVETSEEDTERHSGVLDVDALTKDDDDADVEVTKTYKVAGIKLSDVIIRRSRTVKRVVISVLPPECVIIDREHHELSLDKARFSCVRSRKTMSELREEGYDVEWEDIKPSQDAIWSTEEVTRYFYDDEAPMEDSGEDALDTDADRMVWVHECFMALDYDEDGIAERRRVVMAGCHILENEADEYVPIVSSSAIPMPHKHIGMSYAEIVEDIQKVMTMLTRQMLDNIYAQNVQRVFMSENALSTDNATLDQFLDRTSEVILVRGDPQAAVMPEVITPIVDQIVKAIDLYSQTPQIRTGVAPQLSMDPSVLEKSTAGAFAGALEHASQRSELLARNIAETGLVPLFQKVHYLQREHFDEPQSFEAQGKWHTVDPRTWKRRSSMKVNVGLGFNNKQVMTTLLFSLLQVQKEAIGAGLANPAKLFATLEKLCEEANIGYAGTYFLDPREPGWKAPPPAKDPAMIQAEANAASLAAEAKRKDRELDAKIALDRENLELAGAKEMNSLLTLMDKHKLTVAQVAKFMAEITALNRGDKNQSGPAEDSSQDEFDAAESLGEPGSHYGPPKALPAPADKLEAARSTPKNGKAAR